MKKLITGMLEQSSGGIANLYENLVGDQGSQRLIWEGITNAMADENLYIDKNSSELYLKYASYGSPIPIVYGRMKVNGKIIWIGQEIHHAEAHSLSLAVAICSGPINSVERIWVNDQLVENSGDIKIYYGDEDQLPDSTLESAYGVGTTPGYRGLAYAVIRDLDIAQGKLPRFAFEVLRSIDDPNAVEKLIDSIVIIPGSGEFVYDTIVQKKANNEGEAELINQHHTPDKANAIIALDHMAKVLPNLKCVSVVVNWFGTSIDIADCDVLPGVEYQDLDTRTIPDMWKVAGLTREQAHQIRYDEKQLRYGGTINDVSLIRFLLELKSRGYHVTLYPMILMDLPGKPWRGYLSGQAKTVPNFFDKKNGYRRFIMHYAEIAKSYADAFIIGSELKGLTSIMECEGVFPAVQELVLLLKEVRQIVGNRIQLTYAADWSEYHHIDHNGKHWHHLDDLWSQPEIDVIGIDAYFPLTQWISSQYDLESVVKGWDSGEGYSSYYADDCNKKLPTALAWKNIEWWWSNKHQNADGKYTAWQPKSKKIWFTEYGFPSVDLATNQPNVFHDPHSKDSTYPRWSSGEQDLTAQRIGIQATEKCWQDSNIVERKFLWAWDARPYPTWPNRNDIWSDGDCWFKGHWVQGKLGLMTLDQLLRVLCASIGIEKVSTINLEFIVYGVLLDQALKASDVIKMLQQAYLFDVIQKGFEIQFVCRNYTKAIHISYEALVVENGPILTIQDSELPSEVYIEFLDHNDEYKVRTISAMRHKGLKRHLHLKLPIAIDSTYCKSIAHKQLYNRWMERRHYTFILPMCYSNLKPGDVIILSDDSPMRITNTVFEMGKLKVTAVETDLAHSLSIPGQ